MDSLPVSGSESYSITSDGHFVGSDGFVVPKNFAEFYEQEPLSVRRFLMKKLRRQIVDESVLDLEQDLLLFLHYLPVKSKYRKMGKSDIIECFDPEKQHGASAKRFHNYLAKVMSNRLCTLMNKQKKNPVYHSTNLSITQSTSESLDKHDFNTGEIREEQLHHHSIYVMARTQKEDEEARFRSLYVEQFKDFVRQTAPEILPVIDAIAESGSLKDARQVLGVPPRVFEKHRATLRALKDSFVRGKKPKKSQNAPILA